MSGKRLKFDSEYLTDPSVDLDQEANDWINDGNTADVAEDLDAIFSPHFHSAAPFEEQREFYRTQYVWLIRAKLPLLKDRLQRDRRVRTVLAKWQKIYTKQLNALDNELADINAETDSVSKKTEEVRTEISKLRNTIGECTMKFASTQRILETFEREHKTLESELETLRQEAGPVRDKYLQCVEERQMWGAKVRASAAATKEEVARVQSLHDALTAAKSRQTQYEAAAMEVASLQRRIAEAEAKMNILQADVTEMETRIAHTKEQAATVRLEVVAAQEERIGWMSEKKSVPSTNTEAVEKVAGMIAKTRDELATLRNTLADLTTQRHHALAAEPETVACSQCLTLPSSVTAFPCGHILMCDECWEGNYRDSLFVSLHPDSTYWIPKPPAPPPVAGKRGGGAPAVPAPQQQERNHLEACWKCRARITAISTAG